MVQPGPSSRTGSPPAERARSWWPQAQVFSNPQLKQQLSLFLLDAASRHPAALHCAAGEAQDRADPCSNLSLPLPPALCPCLCAQTLAASLEACKLLPLPILHTSFPLAPPSQPLLMPVAALRGCALVQELPADSLAWPWGLQEKAPVQEPCADWLCEPVSQGGHSQLDNPPLMPWKSSAWD
jgi:hypothetical protein